MSIFPYGNIIQDRNRKILRDDEMTTREAVKNMSLKEQQECALHLRCSHCSRGGTEVYHRVYNFVYSLGRGWGRYFYSTCVIKGKEHLKNKHEGEYCETFEGYRRVSRQSVPHAGSPRCTTLR
jgi:hypothetical protein